MKNENIICIAQIDSVAGYFEYNSKKIISYIKRAEKSKASMVVFPINALSGNLIDDVIKRHPSLLSECEKWLNGIADVTGNIRVIIGYINGSVAIIENGKVRKIINDLPSLYDNICITLGDIADSDLIINMMVSNGNELLAVHNLCSYQAKNVNTPVVYVNSVGATDNISYIGSSAVFNSNGELISRANAFEEQLLQVDITKINEIAPLPIYESKNSFSLDYEYDLERVYKTIIQGIRGYFNKCGIKRAVLGLSGGLDSTVTATLLAQAIGADNVLGISMPSQITSDESKSDARILAENLGIHFTEAPIKPMVDVTSECFNVLFNKINWGGRYDKSFTHDNIQARLRAMYLYGVSNEFSSCIPIATSDKSEAYMGYATINGDMSGGFAPIADVTKTKLFALARWINKNIKNVIPESVLQKRPGAELAIDPKTGKPLAAEDALMPYEFLDEIIWRIENKNESYYDLLNSKFVYENNHQISKEQKTEWLDKFYRRMSSALYKWSIMPPAIIVEKHSINNSVYSQPVTSGKINYKGTSESFIAKICKEI